METVPELFLIRIGLALGMLAIGGFFDIWKREVHDYLWIIFGVAGAALLIFEPSQTEMIFTTLFALIIAPISVIIWRMGLFGGADAFALIALAVIAPQITVSGNTVTPFTTLSNAAVLFVIPLLINAIRNTISKIKGENIFEGFEESTSKKILASFIGYRAKNPKHGFSIEKIEGSVKKIALSFHHAEKEEFSTKPNTWVTPGIPYLLLIIGGFLIQLIHGDMILIWMGINS
ncbi:Preflagellin peptidase protein [Marine Group I thaumarchaeote SCGC AAA799-B03]|uniref:Preflagellin peptidase protein n=3 Tax=Marine Group I TaxID=905826 RepID=A0A087S7S5_9ARCH|nr:Preflagellin peptidase protein [Marine Group I thaumarchaeote SCGC AAA799-D11]KFM17947.1 peptidase protein [Marine Group I thaumarchaeote SCGC RSA3]KFM21779.1 Preflagellin peptidase protein [Marine Group I thaumarchaeote SCGC AAA799-B03]